MPTRHPNSVHPTTYPRSVRSTNGLTGRTLEVCRANASNYAEEWNLMMRVCVRVCPVFVRGGCAG